MRSGSLCIIVFVLALGTASAQKLDYRHQDAWRQSYGKSQSPIDIVRAKALPEDGNEPARISVNDPTVRLRVLDNGHAIEAQGDGPVALIWGRRFAFRQVHFHARSEHTFNGWHYPLEAHLVFQARDGRLAVIGVMYTEGSANALLENILAAIRRAGPAEIPSANISALLPARSGYYHYLGSLTTPPLTENVEWYVMDKTMSLSSRQLKEFTARYDRNNRAVQPLNERTVIHVTD